MLDEVWKSRQLTLIHIIMHMYESIYNATLTITHLGKENIYQFQLESQIKNGSTVYNIYIAKRC